MRQKGMLVVLSKKLMQQSPNVQMGLNRNYERGSYSNTMSRQERDVNSVKDRESEFNEFNIEEDNPHFKKKMCNSN